MYYLAFPLHIGPDGLPAEASYADHVRDMIEELLFTNPGERVNRPDFGVGLLQLVFGPNDEEIATAIQFQIQSALQRWLGDHVRVAAVTVQNVDSSLEVVIQYVLLETGAPQVARFLRTHPVGQR